MLKMDMWLYCWNHYLSTKWHLDLTNIWGSIGWFWVWFWDSLESFPASVARAVFIPTGCFWKTQPHPAASTSLSFTKTTAPRCSYCCLFPSLSPSPTVSIEAAASTAMPSRTFPEPLQSTLQPSRLQRLESKQTQTLPLFSHQHYYLNVL
jgi:hypothetical protein